MSTPTIRAALKRLLAVCDTDESNVLDIDPDLMLDAIVFARAALAAATSGDGLAPRVLAMCKQREWSLHWTSRGAYLHLEASELIEALRGKRGDPLAEAADVLLVLMSITENAGIAWSDVVQQTAATCSRLEACDQYPGEERMDSPATLAAEPVGEGPSNNELDALERQHWEPTGVVSKALQKEELFNYRTFARAVLARWGQPATPPAASLRALVSALGTRTKGGAIILSVDAVLDLATELEGTDA